MDDMNKAATTELLNGLFKANSLGSYLNTHKADMQMPLFHEYITALCQKRSITMSRVIERANIETSFGYQLFNGRRRPSRDTVLQLAFGFDGGVELAQEMLKISCMSALYPRMKRDAAIIYCLHKHMSVVDTQAVLLDFALPLLGGKRYE